jgi:hypothetical protein
LGDLNEKKTIIDHNFIIFMVRRYLPSWRSAPSDQRVRVEPGYRRFQGLRHHGNRDTRPVYGEY